MGTTHPVKGTSPKGRPVTLVDSTLREGQQHGLLSFSPESGLLLARMLDSFHIDMIEVGHPACSAKDRKIAEAICSAGLRAQTLAHARAHPEDVKTAADVGAKWVGIFSGVNDMAVAHKLHKSRDEIVGGICKAIASAKDKGLCVRFTCEDAPRTPEDLACEVFESSIAAGADRISYADTVGVLRPSEAYAAISRLVGRFGPVVHVHCHNDFGLATANALAAYEAGAVALDVTIDGVGERCGVASLAQVACSLACLYGVDASWDLSLLTALSSRLWELVEQRGTDVRPIVGRYAFAHKAGIHIAAEIEEHQAYEPIDPSVVGQVRRAIVSRLMGRRALKGLLDLTGGERPDIVLERLIEALKEAIEPVEMTFHVSRRPDKGGEAARS